MKLADFNALCVREWDKPQRGDVASLCLTEAGHVELSRDMIMTGVLIGDQFAS